MLADRTDTMREQVKRYTIHNYMLICEIPDILYTSAT